MNDTHKQRTQAFPMDSLSRQMVSLNHRKVSTEHNFPNRLEVEMATFDEFRLIFDIRVVRPTQQRDKE